MLAILVFLLLGTGIGFAEISPIWLKWALFGGCFCGLMITLLWRAEEKEELEEEDLVEVARQAIHNEAERLDKRRSELERVLMTYGEWMEFPDFKHLRDAQWDGDVEMADKRIAAILDAKADSMLRSFSDGTFYENGRFQTRKLMLDLFGFMEEIAQIYHPGADRPILETNLESMLKAINRASLQIILLLEEIPLLDVKDMNIRKTSDAVRKASKVYRKYEDIKPMLEPVRYLFHGSKFLMASNPLLAAGWVAGSEVLWKGGKKLGKKAMDAYLLSLVRQSLGIIAWETAGIYDKSYRYRNPDWIYGLELVQMASFFEPTTELIRAVFRDLGSLPLRSSYDRIFLYRCTANHVSPKPERFSSAEWLTEEVSDELAKRLLDFTEKHLPDVDRSSKRYRSWRADMQKRLGALHDLEVEADLDATDQKA